MSLPAPNLDDRTFQQIVDDAKRQIGLRCPEWTDHNVSDPGVTLIELFAWMTEMTLYRLNQVPDRNYIKFLEMIGVTLDPPAPAQVELYFRLSRAIEDTDGEEAFQRTLKARDTIAATTRTETEESVEFATDVDVQMVRPRLVRVTAVQFGDDAARAGVNADSRDFVPGKGPFPIFNPIPRNGDAIYFGFEGDISRNLLELEVDCVRSAATGLDEEYPAQAWEVWNGAESRWDALELVADSSFGFNQPAGQVRNGLRLGVIELVVPPGMVLREINGRRAYWLRCRYTLDLPPIGPEQKRPSAYQRPPELLGVTARTVGAVAPASHCTTDWLKEVGLSDGTPGQVFRLHHAPILARRPGETVMVGERGAALMELTPWTEVADFANSQAEDLHFVCDSCSAEIRFGPNVRQPDGSTRQHGSIPARGLAILLSAFRRGGGTRGNVAAGQISVLKSSIPYIAEVNNVRRAQGGREQETLERAILRGRALLRVRERAVTAEDFEILACRASSGVGRARCVQPLAIHHTLPGGGGIPPGVVQVLLVPALAEGAGTPRPFDLRIPDRVRREVEVYLDERRLLTTVLEVREPEYVYVSTDITLVADPRADADLVARAVRSRLETFLHPLRGGPQGDGWPFRRTLTLADIYAQVQTAGGVAFLLDARMYTSRLSNVADGSLSAEQPVSNLEGVRPGPNELLATREHRIRVRPLSEVGTDDSSLAARS